MNDDNIHTGICIVLPASHYGSNALSHCTLAFLGNTDEVDYPKSRVERLMRHLDEVWFDMFSKNYENPSLLNWVERLDLFGVERDTHVAILTRGEKLMRIRERTIELLEGYSIPYSTQFEYTPHVSLPTPLHGMPSLSPGNQVRLFRPTLWWGNERPELMRPIYVGPPSNDFGLPA